MPYKDKKKNREYMAPYMREYRKKEREAIKKAREMLGLTTGVRKTNKRRKGRQK